MQDLQLLINICLQVFLILDMKINFNKSAVLRVGKRYKVIVVPPMADSHVLHLCSEMRYLGLYFVAGFVLPCNFHRAKAKYFGSLNS